MRAPPTGTPDNAQRAEGARGSGGVRGFGLPLTCEGSEPSGDDALRIA